MAVKVVDSSALAAFLFGEPAGTAVVSEFENARLVAPPLLAFELANVCVKKMRQDPGSTADLERAFRLWKMVGIEEVAVRHDEVVALATSTGLTAYDASYLWLARELSAELITLDRQLARAASSASH